MKLFEKTIMLPITEKGFDDLVEILTKKYRLPDKNHCAAVIATAIRHLPPTQATTTLTYLGHYVHKSLANQLAQFKTQSIQHTLQVQQNLDLCLQDPGNIQAFDELTQAANAGSLPAKEALSRLETKPDAKTNLTLMPTQMANEPA